MCIYGSVMPNKKYTATKKNGGIVPVPVDRRVMGVTIACGKCIECKKKKAREWKVRLEEELRHDIQAEFVTLSFSDEAIEKLIKQGKIESEGYEKENEIATWAVRKYFERWRKEYGKSVKHWLITELGQTNTERIHIHGIIWSKNKEAIERHWQYGNVYIGYEVSNRTVNYITKYINKTDILHKEYNSKILSSKGIGAKYLERIDAEQNRYKENGETRETYTTRQGKKMSLPIYWRNKIYTEEEREKLWIEKLDKNKRYVLGVEIDISKGLENYNQQLKNAQEKNSRLGYGKKKDWTNKKYDEEQRLIRIGNHLEKIGKALPPPEKGQS